MLRASKLYNALVNIAIIVLMMAHFRAFEDDNLVAVIEQSPNTPETRALPTEGSPSTLMMEPQSDDLQEGVQSTQDLPVIVETHPEPREEDQVRTFVVFFTSFNKFHFKHMKENILIPDIESLLCSPRLQGLLKNTVKEVTKVYNWFLCEYIF